MMDMIIGTDEVGYGCISGPVVAGAVAYKKEWDLIEVKDSKKYHERQREKVFDAFINKVTFWTVVFGSVQAINKNGVGKTRFRAMATAVRIVREHVGDVQAIVDGNVLLPDTHDQILVPKADELYPVVSAASIIAKVIRDRYMCIVAHDYPNYFFENNKGYGTAAHVAAIQKYGACPFHRTSYRLFNRLH